MIYKKFISRGLILSILLQFFIPFQTVYADNPKINSSGSTTTISEPGARPSPDSKKENYNDYVVALHKILKDIRRENHKKAKSEDFIITESQKNTLKELKFQLRTFKSKGREKLNKSEIQKPDIKCQQFEKSLDTVDTFVDKLTQEKITSDELTKILPLTGLGVEGRKIQIKKQDGFHFDRKEKIKKQDIELKEITEIKEKIRKKENFDEIGFREDLRKGILVADIGNTGLAYVHNWITERPNSSEFAFGNEIEISPEIEAKALELRYDPVEIYNFVTEEIDFEMYKGSKKGSRGCLIEKRCNDVDLSSLMIALFRASHIPARYVRGDIVRKPEEIRSLFAVETNEMVAEVFNNAGRDFSVVAEDNWTWETIEYFYTPWTWVELYVHYDMSGGRSPLSRKADLIGESTQTEIDQIYEDGNVYEWVGISPSFKTYAVDSGLSLAEEAGFDAKLFWEEYLGSSDYISPYQIMVNELGVVEENKEEKLQKKVINSDPKTMLDVRMPYILEEVTDRVPQLPDSERMKVNIRLEDNQENIYLEKEYFSQELNHRELELKYEGATDDDTALIDEYGNIYNVPPSLVNLKAYLEREGIEETEGLVEIGLGKQLNIIIELKDGDGVKQTDALKFTEAGTKENIVLNFGRVNYLEKTPDEILEDGKGGIAREYMRRFQEELDDIAGIYNHHYRIAMETVIVGENVETLVIDGEVQTYDHNGITIDVEIYGRDYNHVGNYDQHRQDFHLLLGLEGSYLEHAVFEEVTELEAISTVKGIKYARANPSEYTVYEIDQNNISLIDGLPFVEEVKQSMRGAVNEGKTVITPDKRILMEDWYGLVYIAIDPETGNGGYIIGEQPMNGGQIVSYLQDDSEVVLDEFPDECEFPGDFSFKFNRTKIPGKVYIEIKDVKVNGRRLSFYAKIKDETWHQWADVDENNMDSCLWGYGVPIKDKLFYNYGKFQHTFWEFTHGAKFFSPYIDTNNNGYVDADDWGYNYFETRENIELALVVHEDLIASKVNSIRSSYYAGTILMEDKAIDGDDMVLYYVPKSSPPNFGEKNGYVANVHGKILADLSKSTEYSYHKKIYDHGYGAKYCYEPYDYDPSIKTYEKVAKCKKMVSLVGFPIMNKQKTWIDHEKIYPLDDEERPLWTRSVSWQEFIGGLYFLNTETQHSYYFGNDKNREHTFYSLYGLRDFYKSFGINEENPLKFPTSDPKFGDSNDEMTQYFYAGQYLIFKLEQKTVVSNQSFYTDYYVFVDEYFESGVRIVVSMLPVIGDINDLKVVLTGYDEFNQEETARIYGAIALVLGNARQIKTALQGTKNGVRFAIDLVFENVDNKTVKMIVRNGVAVAEEVVEKMLKVQDGLKNKIHLFGEYVSQKTELIKQIEKTLEESIKEKTVSLTKNFESIEKMLNNEIASNVIQTLRARTGIFKESLQEIWQRLSMIADDYMPNLLNRLSGRCSDDELGSLLRKIKKLSPDIEADDLSRMVEGKALIGLKKSAAQVSVSDIEKMLPEYKGKFELLGNTPIGDFEHGTFEEITYFTIRTTEPITVYRAFGGNADETGRFTSSIKLFNKTRSEIKNFLAIKDEFNLVEEIVEINIPVGKTLHVGVAGSLTENGIELSGGWPQIYNEEFSDPEWLGPIYDVLE